MKNIDYNKVCMFYENPKTKENIIEVVQTKNRFTKLYKQFDNKRLKLLVVMDKNMLENILLKF